MAVREILVVGGGSAGFIAAGTLKKRLPEVSVRLVHSTELGIIGVGEGTIPVVQKHLHGTMGIHPGLFFQHVRPTWKLGIKFLWGPRSYFNFVFDRQLDLKYQRLPKPVGFYTWDELENHCLQSGCVEAGTTFPRQENGAPAISESAAYHLENEAFVKFLVANATSLGVEVMDGKVTSIQENEQGIESLRLESGVELRADLFVDCTGFASLLLGKTLGEPYESYEDTLFCDRAIVGGWPRRENEPILPYTVAETMENGWCWQIEHMDRVTRGYVYSSSFTTDNDAEAEFREKNPRIESTRRIRFRSGRYRNAWVKNVMAIGNAFGFVEPLEATAIGVICFSAQALAESIRECNLEPTQSIKTMVNAHLASKWNGILEFLAVHYKFNTRLSNDFWNACRETIEIGNAKRYLDYYTDNGPSVLWRKELEEQADIFNLDSYLTMFVGMQVPHKNDYAVTDDERRNWQQITAAVRRQAEKCYTQEEVLRILTSPQWQWNPDFYQ